MRYKPEYKAQARAKLLEAAGALAKEKGFGTTGVDEFMKSAGMTSGAFYSHFDSKSEFLAALLDHELGRSGQMFMGKDRAALLKALRQYLALSHVEHPERGCPLPALSAEVARAETAIRQAYEDKLLALVASAQAALGGDQVVWAALAQVVGAVTLARAMATEDARQAVLDAAKKQLEMLLGEA